MKKDIRFNLVIIGYGVNKSLIQKKIKNFNLQKSVKILGYRSNPYPYLRASDLFILTSKYEGLPNVLLEAQYSKKYIISKFCGELPILSLGETKNFSGYSPFHITKSKGMLGSHVDHSDIQQGEYLQGVP